MSRISIPTGIDPATRICLQKFAAVLGETRIPKFATIELANLTATCLVQSDSDKKLTSVTDLTEWVAGTENQITVTDDEDGSLTLSLPQDIHTEATPQFEGLGLGMSPSTCTFAINSTDEGLINFFEFYNNGTLVCEIGTDGGTNWILSSGDNEVGQIQYSTPGGLPGVVFWTGTQAAFTNRFNFYNAGSYFRASYNDDGATGALNIIQGGKVGIGVTSSDYMFEVGGTAKVSSLTIVNNVTEFSTDGTLSDNSDGALPTEKAVKTYIDTQMGSDTFERLDGGSSNILVDTLIFDADSSVWI